MSVHIRCTLCALVKIESFQIYYGNHKKIGLLSFQILISLYFYFSFLIIGEQEIINAWKYVLKIESYLINNAFGEVQVVLWTAWVFGPPDGNIDFIRTFHKTLFVRPCIYFHKKVALN